MRLLLVTNALTAKRKRGECGTFSERFGTRLVVLPKKCRSEETQTNLARRYWLPPPYDDGGTSISHARHGLCLRIYVLHLQLAELLHFVGSIGGAHDLREPPARPMQASRLRYGRIAISCCMLYTLLIRVVLCRGSADICTHDRFSHNLQRQNDGPPKFWEKC